jgi:glutathione S-transferase
MAELEIIGGPQSMFVWMTRIACVEKGVAYRLTSIMPHTPEVDAIHPLGKIPVMRHGSVTLCESRAICFYIDRGFDGPALTPRDVVGKAKVEQWLSILDTAFDPVVARPYLGGYHFPGTPDGSPNRPRIDAAVAEMDKYFAILDHAVGTGGHLVGEAFTLPDMILVPMLYYLSKMPESAAKLAAHADLSAYFEYHIERKSVKETLPPPMPGRT